MYADANSPWVTGEDAELLVDQYELTMLQSYWREGFDEEATFSLYTRELPESRNFFLAAGLESALEYFESFEFDADALEYLASLPEFESGFVEWLESFEFTGDVHAVAEGTPVFPDEPWLEVEAPLPEAQLAETFVMNQVHFQTVLASKAVRVVEAAEDRSVVDFGMRRMHGADAALKAARAFHIAGCTATSNVLAGRVYDVPVTGTMAHSYIQSHDSEMEAFRSFAELYPETILLVDTYDSLAGVRKVVELADELGEEFAIRGIRLDSGDLGELAKRSREILDDAGLEDVDIFVSGGLDEYEIRRLIDDGAPVDGFGVGTRMGVARDAPAYDTAYKLTAYAGEGRLKLSPGKTILPGPKQIYRKVEGGEAVRDVVARRGESLEGRPLLEPVMEDGERLEAGRTDLDGARERTEELVAELPPRIRSIESAEPAYRVDVSDALRTYQQEVVDEISEQVSGQASGEA